MGVKPADALREDLRRIDGKGYKAYKDIAGAINRIRTLQIRKA